MKRVFVFQDFKSQKFWSIEVVGTDVTVNYGKLGTDGQTQVKNYATTEEAEKAADKRVEKVILPLRDGLTIIRKC